MKLIRRALASTPRHQGVALAGSEAFDRRDYKAAIATGSCAEGGPPDPQLSSSCRRV